MKSSNEESSPSKKKLKKTTSMMQQKGKKASILEQIRHQSLTQQSQLLLNQGEMETYAGITQSTLTVRTFERQPSILINDIEQGQQQMAMMSEQMQQQFMMRSDFVNPSFQEEWPTFGDVNKQRSQTDMRFKTELCKNWEETGHCNYGTKCQFAHGRHELHTNPTVYTNFRYKSKMCKQFHVYEMPFSNVHMGVAVSSSMK